MRDVARLEELLASTTKQLRDTQDERDRLRTLANRLAAGADEPLIALVERGVRELHAAHAPVPARAIESDLRDLLGGK